MVWCMPVCNLSANILSLYNVSYLSLSSNSSIISFQCLLVRQHRVKMALLALSLVPAWGILASVPMAIWEQIVKIRGKQNFFPSFDLAHSKICWSYLAFTCFTFKAYLIFYEWNKCPFNNATNKLAGFILSECLIPSKPIL